MIRRNFWPKFYLAIHIFLLFIKNDFMRLII